MSGKELKPCNHDYVVRKMQAGVDLKALYVVECVECGDVKSGYASEIPEARFE